MKSYEALERCIGRNTVAVAKALHRSVALVHKWKEPTTDFSDSGALNPLDRIETTIRTAMAEGQGRAAALAPVEYLAQRFGLCVVTLPESAALPSLLRCSHRSIKEFGEFIAELSGSLEDGRISPTERRRIEKEGLEALQQIAVILQLVGRQ